MSAAAEWVRGLGRLKAIAGVVVLLGVLLGGAFALGVVGAPAVSDVQNRFGPVDETTTVIVTNLTVSNPNPIGVDLGGVSLNYTVDLNDVRIARGQEEGIAVGTGNSTLSFETGMRNERIPDWWVAHIRDGERSELEVHARVRSSTLGRTVSFDPVNREISTDLLSSFNSSETRPVNANSPVVSDPVLYVNETSAAWGSVSESETPMEMAFVVYNPKSVPYTVSSIGYEIGMNDVAMGSGETEQAYTIPPKSSRTIRATTAIENEKLDEWWVSHLERNQVTDLRIDFYARIELPTGTVRVPLDALTYEKTIETDIFGNKNEPAPDRAGNGAAADGSDDTAGGDDGAADGSDTATTERDTATATTTDQTTATTTTEQTTATTTTTSTTTSTTTTDDGGLLSVAGPSLGAEPRGQSTPAGQG